MNDWRLEGYSNFLNNKVFKKIIFPDFWIKSFKNNNDFFKGIKIDAEAFVKKYGRGEEYLEGDKIQDFWHTHCVFCTDKITTRDSRECFCTDKYSNWVCKSCFNDFKDRFNWDIEN